MVGAITPILPLPELEKSAYEMYASTKGATFEWTQTIYDFGKIKLNNPVTYQFSFANRGSEPLIISSVKASCGCTVAEYSKDPVAPGQEGFVKATFDAAKPGVFTKTITVNANTEEGVVHLVIKGEVLN